MVECLIWVQVVASSSLASLIKVCRNPSRKISASIGDVWGEIPCACQDLEYVLNGRGYGVMRNMSTVSKWLSSSSTHAMAE